MCMYICVCTCAYIHVYVCIYVCACVYTYMCMYVYVCVHVCVYIYVWLKLFGPGSSSQKVHHKCLLFTLFIDFSTEYIHFPVVSIPVPSQEINR